MQVLNIPSTSVHQTRQRQEPHTNADAGRKMLIGITEGVQGTDYSPKTILTWSCRPWKVKAACLPRLCSSKPTV